MFEFTEPDNTVIREGCDKMHEPVWRIQNPTHPEICAKLNLRQQDAIEIGSVHKIVVEVCNPKRDT